MSANRVVSRPARAALRTAALTAAAVAVAVGAVVAAALVAGEMPGSGRWAVAPVLGAAVAAALAWPPARRWADASADRLLRGARRSPHEVVRAFEHASSRDLPIDELLVQLAEALVRTFGATVAEVWRVTDGASLVRRASVPEEPAAVVALAPEADRVLAGSGVVGRAWLELWLPDLLHDRDPGELRVVPATHAGVLLGVLVLARATGGERFDPDDDAALAELGGRVGLVLHNRDLDAALQMTLADLRLSNEELRASRARLVATADAERRRIERDLHDGAQQHLVALAVNLRLARDAIAEDPASATGIFDELGDDIRQAIAEVRSLAHGIYPPLLMDAGIVEALRVAADRSPSPVTFTAEGVARYPSEVEAATYFCCTEALQNATKHAPGAAVRLHLEGRAGVVRFTIEDDGPGLDPSVDAAAGSLPAGRGLQNMADRVGALGGRLALGPSDSGGARVVGEIPVGASPTGSADPVISPTGDPGAP